jgi:hypothetical protein
MNARDLKQAQSAIGGGTPYRNIVDLVQDRQQIEQLANALDVSRRNIHKDECGQWTISGRWGYLQTWGDQASYLFYYVAHSERKWGAIKRKAADLGWQITQDADDQGCFCLSLPDGVQAEALRQLLGLRRKRQPTSNEIINSEGGSAS